MSDEQRKVVICGGGVIGSAIAYYLTLRGIQPRIIEKEGVACAASGKAGGFLALDWSHGTALDALSRLSFNLHAELAQQLDADYGYHRVVTLALETGSSRSFAPATPELSWLDGRCSLQGVLGTPETTALLEPKTFTQALVDAAQERGAQLIHGEVQGITLTADGKSVRSVRVNEQDLECDDVVIAMGPWSALAARWLPIPAVEGLLGHSIVLRPDTSVSGQALFVQHRGANGQAYSPEVYPRLNGEVYVSGVSEVVPLPTTASAVKPRKNVDLLLEEVAGALSSKLASLRAERFQACIRPVFRHGLPALGPVPGVAGAYLATGHSCWGILNAPGSGAAMAELIATGTSTRLDLSPFDPRRSF